MNCYSIVVEHVYLTYRLLNSVSIKQRLLYTRGKQRPRIESFLALKDVSFSVKRGDTLGIIGSNGAGKSTLLKTLAGVFQPDSGKIEIFSDSISLLTLGAGFEPDLSGIENIYLNGVLLGFKRNQIDEKLEEIIDFAGIGDFIYKPLRTYSSGMRARLAFAISSNIEPEILLLDEVLGIGDEEFREKSQNKIRELITSQRTVVLVSHSMNTVRELCDQVLWLEKGEVMGFGNTDELVEQYLEFSRQKRKAKKNS